MAVESSIFDKVLILINTGLGIRKSLKKLKINNQKFYKDLSSQQKLILKQTKTSIIVVGIGGSSGMKSIKYFPHNFLNNEIQDEQA